MSGFFLDGSWQLMVFIAALFGFAAAVMLASKISSLLRARFDSQVGNALRDQFVTVDADRLWWFSCVVAALIAASTALVSGHWWAGVAAGALALLLPRAALSRIRRRQLERFRGQLPDFLILLSGSLRAGSGLSLALSRSATASPAPLRPQIEKVLADLRLGVSLTEAFASLERRAPLEEVSLLATVFRLGSDTGGSLAQSLDSLAQATRRKLAIESKIRALTAQGRMQAWVMALLPALILFLLAWVDRRSFDELTQTSAGRIVLLTVGLSQWVGFRLVQRIIRIEV